MALLSSTIALARFIIINLWFVTRAAVSHIFGLAPTAKKWDLRTAMIVTFVRGLTGGRGSNPRPIGAAQKLSLRDTGIRGRIWVATTTFRAPPPDQENVREAVFDAIAHVHNQAEDVPYLRPNLADLRAEWTGFRSNAGRYTSPPKITEAEKYKNLMSEPTRTSNLTILYFHGGAYYLMSPATTRYSCRDLAKLTNGRVCSVEYRLAPQAAYPAQQLDALMVYLSLLYPPPGSFHEPVSANDIVLAGDSAGGNMAFALIQVLLHLHRNSENPTVQFWGKTVPVPMPAGVTSHSPFLDVTRSLQSIGEGAIYDYLPTPSDTVELILSKPADDVWPTKPPRGHIYCDLALLDHPLVSPIASQSWKGAPPMWISIGQELLSAEAEVVAKRAVEQGVIVNLEKYEAMPHCFAILLPHLPASQACTIELAKFCRDCVENKEILKSKATFNEAKSNAKSNMDFAKLSKLQHDDVLRGMAASRQTLEEEFARYTLSNGKAN